MYHETEKPNPQALCSRLWNTRGGNRLLAGAVPGAALILGMLHLLGVPLTGWMPPCPFHLLTGFNCPGCGTTRMVQALLEGELGQAFSYNPFFFVLLFAACGALIWFFLRTFRKGWKPLRIDWKNRWWLVLLGLFLLFGVLRNTPWYRQFFF